MESFLSTKYTQNEKQGNGQFKGSRKRSVRRAASKGGFRYLSNNDLTMQFNTTKDPIYFAFEYLEERTVAQLVGDLVQDTLFEITNFVSKLTK